MTSFLLGVGLLAVAGISFAETMPAKPVKPEYGVETKESPMRATGQVAFIEAKAGKLAVKTAEQELSLNVQASATRKALESIKIGDKVNVSYRDQGGILVADAVSKSGAIEGAGLIGRPIHESISLIRTSMSGRGSQIGRLSLGR